MGRRDTNKKCNTNDLVLKLHSDFIFNMDRWLIFDAMSTMTVNIRVTSTGIWLISGTGYMEKTITSHCWPNDSHMASWKIVPR